MKWIWNVQIVCHAPYMMIWCITANWIQYTNEACSYILHIYAHAWTLLGHLLPPKQLSFNLLRILCLFLPRRDAAAPQPEEQPAISHSH